MKKLKAHIGFQRKSYKNLKKFERIFESHFEDAESIDELKSIYDENYHHNEVLVNQCQNLYEEARYDEMIALS